jgi:hypothetical protein
LKKKKIYRAISWLERYFIPEAFKMLQNIEQGREILLEQANVEFLRKLFLMKILEPLMKCGIMINQRIEENGEMPLKRSLTI